MTFRIPARLTQRLTPRTRCAKSGRPASTLGGAIALAGALLVLPACTGPDPTVDADDIAETEAGEPSETVERIAENPSDYIGEIVTVSGEIEALYDQRTFVLTNDQWLEPDEEVLVINLDAEGQVFDAGESVYVTGEVGELTLAEVEQGYDVTWDDDLVREIEADFVSGPVIVATVVYGEPLTE